MDGTCSALAESSDKSWFLTIWVGKEPLDCLAYCIKFKSLSFLGYPWELALSCCQHRKPCYKNTEQFLLVPCFGIIAQNKICLWTNKKLLSNRFLQDPDCMTHLFHKTWHVWYRIQHDTWAPFSMNGGCCCTWGAILDEKWWCLGA